MDDKQSLSSGKARLQLPHFFADTSNIEEIQRLIELGIISGITTNPVIVAKEAGNEEPITYYEKLAKTFPELPLSVQLLDGDVLTLLKQARKFASIAPNIVIKVPMFGDGKGLTVLSQLSKAGIKTNITALMTAEQVLLALLAGRGNGPTYVSLFFNRIKDGGGNPTEEIHFARSLIESFGASTQIITGSIRKGRDVSEAAAVGAHIITVPPKILWEMVVHFKSEEFITQSQTAWQEYLASQQPHDGEIQKEVRSKATRTPIAAR